MLYNNEAVGRIAAGHLLGRGHRSVAFLNAAPLHPAFMMRQSVFAQSVTQAGATLHAFVSPPDSSRPQLAQQAALVESLAKLPAHPTGLFVPNDAQLPGVYHALELNGIKPGRDIEIVGCDNSATCLLNFSPVRPPSTSTSTASAPRACSNSCGGWRTLMKRAESRCWWSRPSSTRRNLPYQTNIRRTTHPPTERSISMQYPQPISVDIARPRTGRRSGRQGFTLVELLVVIGIVTLLISILLPALTKAREYSQMASCASNLHQVGLAVNMYANEQKGSFPPLWTGDDNSNKYIAPGVWGCLENYGIDHSSAAHVCPTAAAYASMPTVFAGADPSALYSYRYNAVIGGKLACGTFVGPSQAFIAGNTYDIARPLKLSYIRGPWANNVAMFADFLQVHFEETYVPANAGEQLQYRWRPNIPGLSTPILTTGGGHQSIHDNSVVHFLKLNPAGQQTGTNNVLYCDGSVRPVQLTITSTFGSVWPDTSMTPEQAP